MLILNPENYCISCRHRLLVETTRQPLCNFNAKNLENIATLRAEA